MYRFGKQSYNDNEGFFLKKVDLVHFRHKTGRTTCFSGCVFPTLKPSFTLSYFVYAIG